MGHGGTLDPLATGVLILGIGNGTKALPKFLECTKSYECVLLFGAATDTYDTEGKVVARRSYDHITREAVKEALSTFKGRIMQKPPIFSALRIQGKRLYEYAREGKPLPREIEERPVTVEELEMVEWMDGGTHEWRWPDKEAEKEQKEVVESVLHLDGDAVSGEQKDAMAGVKRKRNDDDETVNGTVTENSDAQNTKRVRALSNAEPEPTMSSAIPRTTRTESQDQPMSSTEHEPLLTPDPTDTAGATKTPCPAPAVKLRMTVTSGFYVRSLCHDLGAAVGSFGLMASLVRTRQGDFELGKNALEYDDLAKGEEVWSPQVKQMLEDWMAKPDDDKVVTRVERVEDETRGRTARRRNTSSPEI